MSALFLLSTASFAGEPLMINQILIDPNEPAILYAAARPQGVLKSADRGKSWSPARNGLKNTSAYHLALDPANAKTLYLGTFGGGVFKSADGGEHWVEINDGLGNTNIHALAVDPNNPKRVVVGTSTGDLFQSLDGGIHWSAYGEGLPSLEGEVIATLLFETAPPSRLFLGQELLYARGAAGPWAPLGEGLKKEVITTLAFDREHQILYAGTLHAGPFLSRDRGRSWIPVEGPFNRAWVNTIAVSRKKPREIYVSAFGKGFFKSLDQGATWIRMSGGLPLDDDIMSVAIDPEDPDRLYAGTHNKGIFISRDGGTTWIAPEITREPVSSIINSLVPDEAPTPDRAPVIPAPFVKCTKCHGWTDLFLTRKKTFWRVPPNRRDWRPTVKRMSRGAGLTPAETEEIISFLNTYSQRKPP